MSSAFWKPLFHRWFVEYNPLYLLSAGCVVLGVNQLSQGFSHSAYGAFAVAAVAELYAWALIASAAFLVRSQLRRPAVMLALLVAIYQCDPTLHSETCAYLGEAGVLAAAVWLASFLGKLIALGWALRVRASRWTLLLPTLGALGVLLVPPFLHRVNPTRMSSIVALGVFGLFAAGLWSNQRITSLVALDASARRVFGRTVKATWAIWSVLLLSHVWFWIDESGLTTALFVPVLLLLSTRWLDREASVWKAAIGALLIGLLMPAFFATIALMTALALGLRALRRPGALATECEPSSPSVVAHGPARLFGLAERGERLRLGTGAASALYLATWTLAWSGGPLPEHGLWLDSGFTAVLLGMVWALRAYVAFMPLALSYLHLAIKTGLLCLPRTRAQWGMSEVGLGFVLLVTAVFTSWHSKRWPQAEEATPTEPPDEAGAVSE